MRMCGRPDVWSPGCVGLPDAADSCQMLPDGGLDRVKRGNALQRLNSIVTVQSLS